MEYSHNYEGGRIRGKEPYFEEFDGCEPPLVVVYILRYDLDVHLPRKFKRGKVKTLTDVKFYVVRKCLGPLESRKYWVDIDKVVKAEVQWVDQWVVMESRSCHLCVYWKNPYLTILVKAKTSSRFTNSSIRSDPVRLSLTVARVRVDGSVPLRSTSQGKERSHAKGEDRRLAIVNMFPCVMISDDLPRNLSAYC